MQGVLTHVRRHGWRWLLALWWGPVLLLAVLPSPGSLMMLSEWFTEEHVIRYDWVPLERISPAMQLAVIAAEDQKFATHLGFDMDAIASAWKHNQRGRTLRGASTLSQQVAKNLFFPFGRNWFRKGVEAVFTVQIETCWSKRRILEMYLNVAEFGPGIFGVEAAARHFYGRPASSLNRAQAARLAAVLPSPKRFSASKPSPYVQKRATWIQRQMGQLGTASLQAVPRVPGWLHALFFR